MKINSATIFANRESILRCLKENNFRKVRVYYCGSGDSGGIEDVDIEGLKGKEPRVKFVQVKTAWDADAERWNETLGETEISLSDAVREHCYDLLSREHGGWENDSGGSGEFVFDPESDKIHWTHNEYYTQTNTSEHEV